MLGGGWREEERERENRKSIMGRETIFLKNHFMGPVKGIPASLSKTPEACVEKMLKCLSLNPKDYINEDSENHYIR